MIAEHSKARQKTDKRNLLEVYEVNLSKSSRGVHLVNLLGAKQKHTLKTYTN